MNIFSQYGPYRLKDGLSWETEREAYADRCLDVLAEYAPNIKRAVLHREVLTPVDLERRIPSDRRKYFPRQNDTRSDVQYAAGTGLRGLSDTD